MSIKATSYEAALEYVREMSDKDFIESCFQVIDKRRVPVPMILNKVQSELEAAWSNFNIVLKYRKPGVSVLVQDKFLARILRHRNRNTVVLSYDKEATARMLERTEWTLNHLPFPVKTDRQSKNEIKIEATNSKIFIGTPGSKAFGRGDDITDLHLSELAFWEDTSVMTGLMEALTYDPFVVVESTANGPSNTYAQLWRRAKSGQSNWKAHFFPWWIDDTLEMDVPAGFVHTEDEVLLKAQFPQMTDRKLAWRRWKLSTMMEPELFPQEYPASEEDAFLVLGDCIFNKKALLNYQRLVSYTKHVGYLAV